MFGRDKPVVSAADLSGFNKVAGTNGRNVVVVVVESLGYFSIRTRVRSLPHRFTVNELRRNIP